MTNRVSRFPVLPFVLHKERGNTLSLYVAMAICPDNSVSSSLMEYASGYYVTACPVESARYSYTSNSLHIRVGARRVIVSFVKSARVKTE